MNIVSNIQDWREIRKKISHQRIGFVPTMGYLHEGHISLCNRSKAENDITIVSIFANPTQFNQTQDLQNYPKNIPQDIALLESIEIDYLLLPTPEQMYSDQYQIQIHETDISLVLEGKYRPGHFTGVLTIMLKLLNLIQPKYVYFGEKDYQQLILVKKMCEALLMNTEVVACPTIRAEDGLALSSRNSKLSIDEKKQAAHLYRLLCSHLTLEQIEKELIALGFKVDYIAEKWGRRLAAVWLNEVRLIDNIRVG